MTFKSHQSVPPYRIENQCSDVYIYFVQACLAGERPGRWNWLQPRTNGNALAYAWGRAQRGAPPAREGAG